LTTFKKKKRNFHSKQIFFLKGPEEQSAHEKPDSHRGEREGRRVLQGHAAEGKKGTPPEDALAKKKEKKK